MSSATKFADFKEMGREGKHSTSMCRERKEWPHQNRGRVCGKYSKINNHLRQQV